jgi:hypothetical protein
MVDQCRQRWSGAHTGNVISAVKGQADAQGVCAGWRILAVNQTEMADDDRVRALRCAAWRCDSRA